MQALRTLVAFAIWEDFRLLNMLHKVPTQQDLTHPMAPSRKPYPGDERSLFPVSGKLRTKLESAEKEYEQQVEDDCKSLVQHLLLQWPCLLPTIQEFVQEPNIDIQQAMDTILSEWQLWFRNLSLSKHVAEIQLFLDKRTSDSRFEKPILPSKTEALYSTFSSQPVCSQQIPDLMRRPAFLANQRTIDTSQQSQNNGFAAKRGPNSSRVIKRSNAIRELASIIRNLTISDFNVRSQYGQDLKQSLKSFEELQSKAEPSSRKVDQSNIAELVFNTKERIIDSFFALLATLSPDDACTSWLQLGGLWPYITPVTILEQLRSCSPTVFDRNMKEAIIAYSVSITAHQRACRLEDAILKRNDQKLFDEQSNVGHEN